MNFSFGKIWRRAHVSHGEYGDVLSVGHVTTILQFHWLVFEFFYHEIG